MVHQLAHLFRIYEIDHTLDVCGKLEAEHKEKAAAQKGLSTPVGGHAATAHDEVKIKSRAKSWTLDFEFLWRMRNVAGRCPISLKEMKASRASPLGLVALLNRPHTPARILLQQIPQVNLQVYEFTGYYSPKSRVIELW